MKLADDVLLEIIEILRKGLVEEMDVSQLLRKLDLSPNSNGKLSLSSAKDVANWTKHQPETD